VRGESDDPDAADALGGFTSFPAWMWRNAEMIDFVGWLRTHNDALAPRERVSFYGLDLYSLHKSIAAIVSYLDEADPNAAKEARVRYSCFDHFGELRRYGFAAKIGLAKPCEDEALRELIDLRRRHSQLLHGDGPAAEEAIFSAEQNALLVENAERYYRAMFGEATLAWNQRDAHMMETLQAILAHLKNQSPRSKVVVWSHNLHVGDARATEMGKNGQISLGQLVRESWGQQALLIGFTTDSGTVTAASNWWDSPPQRVRLKPALQESFEAVFHQTHSPRFLLNLRPQNEAVFNLRAPRLERSVGVVYRPDVERDQHYFEARLSDQFDLVIHIDETRAVEPIECTAEWDKGEVPETFPTGV
jgi:erythromycin esterase-like protein